DVEVLDVALFLEEPRDLDLQLRRRHDDAVLQRLVGVADAREHVCDWICKHRFSPTSCSWSCRGSSPDARARAGRSGTGRTCGTPRGAGRSGCTECSCEPCSDWAATA